MATVGDDTMSYAPKVMRVVLLLASLLVGGCGGSQTALSSVRSYSRVGATAAGAALVGANELKRTVLAEGSLPDHGRFVIFATPSKTGGALYYYAEGPGRSARRHLWGGGGGIILGGRNHGTIDDQLELVVGGGCGSSHPYTLAFGLLRDANDTVIDQTHGRHFRFMVARIPRRFDTKGVLVYSLLVTGRNRVVTRAHDGRVVDSEWQSGGCVGSSRPS
ncbi:MAG TPA: hypothetical protein VGP17_07230 [Solirubrobacteraceae bacterium]|jgi:hypothetical protein|nr:hypothetical protein [Solirubrobacteraceae bacterium]